MCIEHYRLRFSGRFVRLCSLHWAGLHWLAELRLDAALRAKFYQPRSSRGIVVNGGRTRLRGVSSQLSGLAGSCNGTTVTAAS